MWKYKNHESWFRLSTYDKCNGLRNEEWLRLLSSRQYVEQYFRTRFYYNEGGVILAPENEELASQVYDYCIKEELKKGYEEPSTLLEFSRMIKKYFFIKDLTSNNIVYDQEVRFSLEKNLENPFCILNKNFDKKAWTSDFKEKGCGPYRELFTNTVSPLTIGGAFDIYTAFTHVEEVLISDGEPTFISEEIFNDMVENLGSLQGSQFEGVPFDFHNSDQPNIYGSGYVRINMNAPDDMILRDFKDFLKAYREKTLGVKKYRNTTAFVTESWGKEKILPYIDLMNWQTYMKKTYHDFEPLTEYKIGCLLFPDSEVDPAEKIRKTVKPKAYEALDSVEKMRFELGDS